MSLPRGRRSLPSALALAVSLLVCARSFAAEAARPLDQYSHRFWQTQDGLPQNAVQSLAQTADGYLWLATQEGLARFDGVGFATFDRTNMPALKANNVVTLLALGSELWAGTISGDVLRIHGSQVTATFTVRNVPSGTYITALARDARDRLWIGTSQGGVALLEDGQFTAFPGQDELPSSRIAALLVDREGELWVATAAGLAHRHAGSIERFGAKDGLAGDVVTALAEDGEGALWIGTTTGLTRFHGGRFTTYTTRDGLSHNAVKALHVDPEGTVWIGTAGGLSRYQGGRFSSFTSKEGLTSAGVISLLTDREGTLWLGTEGGGLNQLRASRFTTFTGRQGLSNDTVYVVAPARDGGLWVGSYDGSIDRLEGGRFRPVLAAGAVGASRVRALHESRSGALWIGTDRGLHHYQHGQLTSFTAAQGQPNASIRVISEDRAGVVWVGTDGAGLLRVLGGRLVPFGKPEGLSSDQVRAVYEDHDGQFWIGTYAGLARFKDGRFTTLTTADGLAHNLVRTIVQTRDGVLWIGTYGGGLSRYKDGKFTNYTTRNGLFSDVVYQILEDRDGNLWMSCNKGIFRVKRADLEEVAAGRAARIRSQAFDESDGMASRECNGGAPGGVMTPDGRMWFPTLKGVAMVDPARMPMNRMAPPVVIQQVVVDKESFEVDRPGNFAPHRQRLEFRYAALSYVAPAKVRYRYRLDPFDGDWTEAITATNNRTAQYTSLRPGHYVFRVKAANDDEVWNEEGAAFEFDLRPAFYQTSWFYALCVLALIGGTVGVVVSRTFHLQRNKAELEARVQEALARNKVLSGLLPICAGCKNIRDDRGYWNQIEVYIRDHSDAQFSHGLCPECVRRLYPDYADKVLEEELTRTRS